MFFGEELRELTPRQMEAAFLVSRGLSDAEMAATMGCRECTVKKHLQVIRERLGFDGSRLNLALAILKEIA
jgi:DNA-binding NarL/FixJ family response regulator